MNAWLFGTAVLIVLICVAGVLIDRQADRGHEIRWHERFYQPQQAHLPPARVIDVPATRLAVPSRSLDSEGSDVPR